MGEYPDISDHGLIGDLQTAALVDTNGTIDWFCFPRFDSPSVFASLLDAERGGFCRIAPDTSDFVTRQLYLPETAILVTRYMTEEGVGEVVDFMPVAEGPATDRHRLVRLLRVVRGSMRFVGEIHPRFDYGRASHTIHPSDVGAVFSSDDAALTMHRVGTPIEHGGERAAEVERVGDGIRLHITLHAGESTGMMLETGGVAPRRDPASTRCSTCSSRPVDFWRRWLDRSTYTGRWREMVTRSAMTLKLMTYAPTGALVAAPTAALPEQVGGERNWDYRYTWVRDASFSVYALLGLGYTDEAEAFVGWLMDRIARERRRRVRSAEDHVPGRWLLRPGRGDPRPPRGLPRVEPRSHRQRRRRPAPAGHLRRGDGLDLPRRHARPAAAARRAGRRSAPCSTGSATTGTSPRRGSGRPGADDSRSRTAGSCAGSRSTVPSGWPSRTAGRRRSRDGPRSATGSTSRS